MPRSSAVLDSLKIPIVLAPLGGGPSTPELAAAVADAGGVGFIAAGYRSASDLEEAIGRTRALTDGVIAVNVFSPGSGPADPHAYHPFLQRLAQWAEQEGVDLGEPRYSDDDWQAKIELLLRDQLPVVSFTFGCPEDDVISALKQARSEVWVTVTTPAEADEAQRRGADVLVLQGAEAGGHRGSFSDQEGLAQYGLLPLLSLVSRRSTVPLVASGGIATGAALAAVLCAGASAAQIGTAFMLATEAGTSEVHRDALKTDAETALTRAFTGRLARGIRNQFLNEHTSDAPIAYPELHYVTSPMRRQAREAGNPELVNLWAGEAHALAEEAPAALIIERLLADADRALRDATGHLA